MDTPGRVVGVAVDQDDRLPRAELHPARENRNRHRRRNQTGKHMVGPMARRTVAMPVAGIIARHEGIDEIHEVFVTAGARLEDPDSARPWSRSLA